VAPETGVRLKSVPPETRKRNQRDREIRERYQKGAELINRARSAWGTSRYYQRVELKKQLAPFVPRGTVGNSIKGILGPECSSCDERTKQNRGPAAAFAKERLERARDRSVSYNPARLNLRRIKVRLKDLLGSRKEKRPFPSIDKKDQEEEEEDTPEGEPEDYKDDEPDYGGGSDDDRTGAAAQCIAAN